MVAEATTPADRYDTFATFVFRKRLHEHYATSPSIVPQLPFLFRPG